ncbi:MAG TPA: iron ABC transporter permease [Bdellovibrionota bacterium]|nr:iron ABC transporter permease [Bdellovibrionota bacterium]
MGRNYPSLILASLLAWAISFALALKLGSVSDAPIELVMDLRLPRALLGTAVGLGLAVAGATLQALFANPLCEPYTLGISSGSTLGAVVGSALGFNWAFAGLTGTAFIGALAFTLALYGIGRAARTSAVGFLLTGVMLGLLGSSLVALVTALADPNGIQSALFWLLGDLSRARSDGASITLVATLALSVVLWLHWRDLDALLIGEQGAEALGIEVGKLRRKLVVITSLLIAFCVSASGIIGFVGLIIPHLARKSAGALHLRMLPVCAIWGAAALTLADVLARMIARPYEFPVGVVTALVGIPLFLAVMLRRPAVGGKR